MAECLPADVQIYPSAEEFGTGRINLVHTNVQKAQWKFFYFFIKHRITKNLIFALYTFYLYSLSLNFYSRSFPH
jgi:hypothetical protein